jgi:DNA-binding NtrC family response regulator
MATNILWLDEEDGLDAFVLRLQIAGHKVERVHTLTEALQQLTTHNYGLLILDVIIPMNSDDKSYFSSSATDNGNLSGLVFYKMFKHTLNERGIEVMVFTIREDLREQFVQAGLKAENYVTKQEASDVARFADKVCQIVN